MQPLTGRAETMFSTDTYGAFGCLKHNRLYHKERGEWVQFTHLQMTAIRAIYTYCNLAFIVQQRNAMHAERGHHAVRQYLQRSQMRPVQGLHNYSCFLPGR